VLAACHGAAVQPAGSAGARARARRRIGRLTPPKAALDDLVFSHFGFRYAVAAPAPVLAALDPRSCDEPGSQAAFTAQAALVIDLGFSSTCALHRFFPAPLTPRAHSTVVPVFDARVQWAGVRRINLGGKALTNLLKELVSYRCVPSPSPPSSPAPSSMNVMDEFYLIEKIKERLCYVAPDVEAELASAQAPRLRAAIARDYVLPDGAQHARGFVRGEADDPRRAERAAHAARRPAAAPSREEEDEEAAAASDPFSAEQALSLCNERFMVPEALLHPSGVGSPQAGLAEAALAAVSACGADIRPLLWSRVLLVGGGAALPGLRERLWAELRPLVPEDCELLLSAPPQPACSAWRGGSAWAAAEGGAMFRWAAQGREVHAAAAAAGPRAHAETFVHHGSTGRPPAGRVW